MDQTVVNVAITAFGAMIGYIVTGIRSSIKELQEADSRQIERVNRLEVDVASAYVRKQDFDKFEAILFSKLDRIENKLDGKVDK